MTYKDIAKKYYIDQRTAKRYVENNLPLSELEHRTYPSILDQYEPVIRSMLAPGPVFAKTVFDELKKLGYTGCYTLVNRRVQQIIKENTATGVYPADCPLSKNRTIKHVSIAKKIKEENNHAADNIR